MAAAFALPAFPALSLHTGTAALPVAAVVPPQARSWAIYMSTLHGECTPQALQNLLNISPVDARKYVTQLIADGAIKANPILQSSVTEFVKTADESLLDKVKKRVEMKVHAESEKVETPESGEGLHADLEFLEDFQGTDPNMVADDSPEEVGVKESELLMSELNFE